MAGFFLLFNSCKKPNRCDCFKPRGETVIETRSIGNFNTLHTYDKIDVYYTQDSTLTTPIVQIKTGKNLVGNITTKIVDSELRIENANTCNFVRGEHNDVTVYVTAPRVKYFIQDGVGNIFGTNTVVVDTAHCFIYNSGDIHLNVKTKGIMSHTHGIGDLYLTGVSESFFSNIVGQGFIYAQDCSIGYCFIYFRSNGEARVRVTGQLDCELASTGNIYYTGSPGVVNAKVTGKGAAIKF
jgi:hypothetical protein